MVLNAGEEKMSQGRCFGGLSGAPGTLGENRELWALSGGGVEGRGISLSLSSPLSMGFLSRPVVQGVYPLVQDIHPH